MDNTTNKGAHQFDGLYQAGCIVNIALNALGLMGVGTYALITLITMAIPGMGAASGILGGLLVFLLVIMAIEITSIVFSIMELKSKSTKKYIINGVFGVISNLIGGILVLCAPKIEDVKQQSSAEIKFDEESKQDSKK